MKPQDLARAVEEVRQRAPDAELAKNVVGNLAIWAEDDNEGWEYVGYMDLSGATVHWLDGSEAG